MLNRLVSIIYKNMLSKLPSYVDALEQFSGFLPVKLHSEWILLPTYILLISPACYLYMYTYTYILYSRQGWQRVGLPGLSGSLGSLFGGSSGSHPQWNWIIWMWPRFLIDHMFFRKRHWHLISEWTLQLGLVNALNHHWCKTSLLLYFKLFWSMCTWCPEISFSRILCVGPVLYPVEIYSIVSHLIFSMSFYITFKKKTLACGSYVGHIPIAQWVNKCDAPSTLIAVD